MWRALCLGGRASSPPVIPLRMAPNVPPHCPLTGPFSEADGVVTLRLYQHSNRSGELSSHVHFPTLPLIVSTPTSCCLSVWDGARVVCNPKTGVFNWIFYADGTCTTPSWSSAGPSAVPTTAPLAFGRFPVQSSE